VRRRARRADGGRAPTERACRALVARKEFIEYENPFDVGLTGLLGFSSGYHAMMRCDVLLMIGCDFPYQQFFPRTPRSSRSTSGGAARPAHQGRPRSRRRCENHARALLPKLTQHQDDRHLKAAREHYAKTRKGLDELATAGSGARSHPQYVRPRWSMSWPPPTPS